MEFTVFKTCLYVLILFSGAKLQETTTAFPSEPLATTAENVEQVTAPPAFPLPDNSVEGKDNVESTASTKRGRCVCAVFDAEEAVRAGSKPIFAFPSGKVSCDAAGQQDCSTVCIVAAGRARGNGAPLLCSVLGHTEKLSLSLYSNICGSEEWKYTGITEPMPICCHEGLVVDCEKLKKGHMC